MGWWRCGWSELAPQMQKGKKHILKTFRIRSKPKILWLCPLRWIKQNIFEYVRMLGTAWRRTKRFIWTSGVARQRSIREEVDDLDHPGFYPNKNWILLYDTNILFQMLKLCLVLRKISWKSMRNTWTLKSPPKLFASKVLRLLCTVHQCEFGLECAEQQTNVAGEVRMGLCDHHISSPRGHVPHLWMCYLGRLASEKALRLNDPKKSLISPWYQSLFADFLASCCIYSVLRLSGDALWCSCCHELLHCHCSLLQAGCSDTHTNQWGLWKNELYLNQCHYYGPKRGSTIIPTGKWSVDGWMSSWCPSSWL